MDTRKILAGVITWTLGLLVPALYHVLLMNAAVKETGYSYSFHSIVKCFFDLPWIVWPYIVATAVVGMIVIVSGLRGSKEPLS